MSVTKRQIKQIHMYLPARIKADKDAKADLVIQYTEDPNKCSTTQLSYVQAEKLIVFLKTGVKATDAIYANFDKNNRQHLTILSFCRQMAWITYSENAGRLVADLERLGFWLKKYGYLKKPLMVYTKKELPKLVSQIEQITKKYLAGK